MSVTVRGTDILFNDGTTQSTAAVLAPAIDQIGSIIVAFYVANGPGGNNISRTSIGSTFAGSSLRYNVAGISTVDGPYSVNAFNSYVMTDGTGWSSGGTSLSGTWRCMSYGKYVQSWVDGCGGTHTIWTPILLIRIA